MRTVIHIGSDKTGTTSLQTRFANNREELAERGILYPDIDGRPDHRSLAKGLQLPPVSADGDVLLLSSEALWPLPPHQISALLDQMPPGSIEVVAYLREPGSFAEAAFLQRCRMCATEWELFTVVKLLGIPPRVNPIAKRSILRLRQLQQWLKIGGAELAVRPYTPRRWANGDIMADFCSVAGIADAAPMLTAGQNPVRNRTLDLNTIHASVLVRQRFGPEMQARFIEQHDGPTDQLRPPGMYTPERLRADIRRRTKPVLAELDRRLGDVTSSLAIDDGPQIAVRLDRRRARELAAALPLPGD